MIYCQVQNQFTHNSVELYSIWIILNSAPDLGAQGVCMDIHQILDQKPVLDQPLPARTEWAQTGTQLSILFKENVTLDICGKAILWHWSFEIHLNNEQKLLLHWKWWNLNSKLPCSISYNKHAQYCNHCNTIIKQLVSKSSHINVNSENIIFIEWK